LWPSRDAHAPAITTWQKLVGACDIRAPGEIDLVLESDALRPGVRAGGSFLVREDDMNCCGRRKHEGLATEGNTPFTPISGENPEIFRTRCYQ
jgi:hypothetical protein